MEDIIFEDRRDAGRRLAKAITKRGYSNKTLLVLGIPRGGVVVADEVAEAMSSPLDVVIVRKIRAPYQPELGIGAVVDGDNISIINEELVRALGVSADYLDSEIACQREEIERRLQIYRGDAISGDRRENGHSNRRWYCDGIYLSRSTGRPAPAQPGTANCGCTGCCPE